MSSDQSSLFRYADDPDLLYGDIRDYISGIAGRVYNRATDIIDVDWWGRSPFDIETDDDIWVYQFVSAYTKSELGESYDFSKNADNRSARTGSGAPEVQFKTGIYVIGEPTPRLEERIRDIDNGRLITAFNTGPYESYMDGFGFTVRNTYIQKQKVSARDVQDKGYGLGVPWFEVEAYDEDGELEGVADGYFDPFTTETQTITTTTGEDTPKNEVWRVRSALNRSRGAGGQWDIGPEGRTGASKRAQQSEIVGKDVYIGPFKIGTVTKRGTAWLRREYADGGPYADKATITAQSGIPAQALQKGAKLYKYKETDSSIHLSTTEPSTGFDPTDASDVSPDQTGKKTTVEEVTEVLLEDDEPTTFTIQRDEDEGRLLGLYDPPAVREIETETELV